MPNNGLVISAPVIHSSSLTSTTTVRAPIPLHSLIQIMSSIIASVPAAPLQLTPSKKVRWLTTPIRRVERVPNLDASR